MKYVHGCADCQGARPRECPAPEVPENGGLVCVTVNSTRYCKPFCNHVSHTCNFY